jgi:hypothetical protein
MSGDAEELCTSSLIYFNKSRIRDGITGKIDPVNED